MALYPSDFYLILPIFVLGTQSIVGRRCAMFYKKAETFDSLEHEEAAISIIMKVIMSSACWSANFHPADRHINLKILVFCFLAVIPVLLFNEHLPYKVCFYSIFLYSTILSFSSISRSFGLPSACSISL